MPISRKTENKLSTDGFMQIYKICKTRFPKMTLIVSDTNNYLWHFVKLYWIAIKISLRQMITLSLIIANKLVPEIIGFVFKVNSKFKEINSPVFPLKTGWSALLESTGLMILPPGNHFLLRMRGSVWGHP